MPQATIVTKWDSYNQSHYWALDGLRGDDAMLNGLGMGFYPASGPPVRVRESLATMNARRVAHGWEPITIPDKCPELLAGSRGLSCHCW